MKTLSSNLLLAAAIGCALACDSTGPGPVDQGVQIGSEGLLRDCGTEGIQGTTAVEGFDLTPEEWAGDILGDFNLTLDLPDAPVSGGLTVGARSYSVLAGEDDCVGIWMDVSGTLTFADALDESGVTGNVLVSRDDRVDLVMWTDEWSGSLQPSFDPTVMEVSRLRLSATVDPAAIDGTAEFLGCTTTCESETIGGFTGTAR